MKFEKDLLISYAHIDNEVFIEGEKGWITAFHRSLEIRLAQLIGRKPVIWRDAKLQGNDDFSQEILDQFPNIALLVSIVSPRYVRSDWCVKEVQEFSQVARSGIGMQIDNKSRVFKVVKTPVPLEEHPEVIRDLLGYEFFHVDVETGKAKEFSKHFGPESERAYWVKLDDMAHDMAELIRTLEKLATGTPDLHSTTCKSDQPTSPIPQEDIPITVYLAETSYDLNAYREQIKRELLSHGCRVLPDQQLSLFAPEFTEKIRQMMDECQLSIHLIGSEYGLVPEGTDKARSVLQNEVAAQKSSQQKEFQRLIWIPADLSVADERQRHFLDLIKNDAFAQQGAEVLETSLAELTFAIHDHLAAEKNQRQDSLQTNHKKQARSIYLICDQQDMESIAALENFLFDQGFDVIIPVFEGDEAMIRMDHQENLKTCDAVILYYGLGNEFWLRAKMRELIKIVGYGRDTPLLHRAIYLVDSEQPRKKRFRMQGIPVMYEKEAFSPVLFHGFIQQLRESELE